MIGSGTVIEAGRRFAKYGAGNKALGSAGRSKETLGTWLSKAFIFLGIYKLREGDRSLHPGEMGS